MSEVVNKSNSSIRLMTLVWTSVVFVEYLLFISSILDHHIWIITIAVHFISSPSCPSLSFISIRANAFDL